jgi:signal transduction histidine kinase
MFQHSWKIWTLFLLCLAIILPAMVWVTIKANQLEESRRQVLRENRLGRLDAELQELVNSALWRMDSMLTPLIVQEASRPDSDYQLLAAGYSKGLDLHDPAVWNTTVSPIVRQPSPFVLLHFQVSPDDQWGSPQALSADLIEPANANGISTDMNSTNKRRLDELAASFSNHDLIQLLPQQLISDLTTPENTQNQNDLPLIANSYPANGQVFLPNQSEQLANLDVQQYAVNPDLDLQQNDQPQSENASADPPRAQQQNAQAASEEFQPQMRGSRQYSRGAKNAIDFQQRADIGQNIAQNYFLNTSQSKQVSSTIREGVSRPLWFRDKLLLARRTLRDDQVFLQGCWFDWPKLRAALKERIADLLPEAELLPVDNVADIQAGRMLVTLPIQLDVSRVKLDELNFSSVAPLPSDSSPMRFALILAWTCLGLGIVAVAILLHGVVKLSERRASFVSAVTHELRTPLTTFRMYAEMLARRMVKTPEQQQQYCETLQVEADRLSHLVENVLQFARLEHSRQPTTGEQVLVGEMIERFRLRFQDRVQQSQMQLEIALTPAAAKARFRSDSAAIEHILYNLVDNACKYARLNDSRPIRLLIDADARSVSFRVCDHGPGIAVNQQRRIFKPFSKSAQAAAHSAPGVGLGLALCRRLAKQLGGRLLIENSSPADGTTFLLQLPRPARD